MQYCVFLYGVGIPGGKKIDMPALPNLLANLPSGFQYQGSIGKSGNLLFWGPDDADAGKLQAIVKNRLCIECVVKTLPDLKKCLQRASKVLEKPLLVQIQKSGVTWEIGVVLLSNPIPDGSSDSVWQYSLKNAESICSLDSRTLLVKKRRTTSSGSRVMWGSTVLNPLQRQFRKHGISVGCLTSRSLNVIQQIVDRLNSNTDE
jgi:hypothetical protein